MKRSLVALAAGWICGRGFFVPDVMMSAAAFLGAGGRFDALERPRGDIILDTTSLPLRDASS